MMTACPVAVRSPLTSQPLLPEVPGPSMANRPTASSPRCRTACSRQSFAGKPANRMWVASQTPSGVHGSQRPGCRGEGRLGQTFVDAADVRLDPVGRFGVLRREVGEAASRGVVDAGAPDEAVPGEGVDAEEGGRGAVGAAPFDLQLPGAVAGGDPALGAGEFAHAVGAQMWDTPGISVDLGAHAGGLLCFRLGSPK